MNRAIHPWGELSCARSTLIRLKIYHRQYYAFNQRCRICECYWYNGPYFSRMGGDFFSTAEAAPKSTKMPEMAPSRVTNKKKPYETSELICNPISHEAFTQKWSRAINDVLCGNCLKGSLYFSPF